MRGGKEGGREVRQGRGGQGRGRRGEGEGGREGGRGGEGKLREGGREVRCKERGSHTLWAIVTVHCPEHGVSVATIDTPVSVHTLSLFHLLTLPPSSSKCWATTSLGQPSTSWR